MNPENFIVRRQLEAVERFRDRDAWEKLSEQDIEAPEVQVAGLPRTTSTTS